MSKLNVDPPAEGMHRWQEKFENGPLKPTPSNILNNQPFIEELMKNFKYSSGFNTMGEAAKMTRLATMKQTPTFVDLDKDVLCFWLGSAWKNKPIQQDFPKDARIIKIVEGKPLKVR